MPSADLLAPAFAPILVVDPEVAAASQAGPGPVDVQADPVLVGAAQFPPVILPDGAIPITWQGVETYAMEGQWIVQLDGVGGTPEQQSAEAGILLAGIAAVPSLTPLNYLGSAGTFLIQAPPDVGFTELEAALSAIPGFQFVEPNLVVTAIAATPNDPDFSQLHGLDNTGQTGGTADADIDAPEAWNISTGSSTVVVGVIDTGVDYTHPDLAANMWINPGEIAGNTIDDDLNGYVDDVYGYDFINGDGDPLDEFGHGTHVAGIIGAVGNNSVGVSGVNWDVQIMALQVFDSSGATTDAAIIEAINYATMMRLAGVNLLVTNSSWGGPGFSQAIENAIKGNRDAGILYVAAAGNDGGDNDGFGFYPAAFDLDNIISVAATDTNDNLASFSNYGLTSVDLGAPGVAILSTFPGGYVELSGTSMAAPHVAGVAALAWSAFPNATYQEIRDAILLGADPVAALDGFIAGGRLNAFNTLGILANPFAPAVTVFAADFSDGSGAANLDGFTLDNSGGIGLWHLSTGRGSHAGHSSDDSLYFGTGEGPDGFGHYDVGYTNGQITSPVIDLTDAISAHLSFAYFLATEEAVGFPFDYFDVAIVQVAENGGFFTDVAINLDGSLLDPSGTWRTALLNLSAFAGSSIEIRFVFDSIDDSFNYYEGWYVDDVTVTAIIVDPDVGDTLEAATVVALGPTAYTHEEVVGNGPYFDKDVDLYQFTVQDGTILKAGTDLPAGGVSVDTMLRLFDATGAELAIDDDSGPDVYSLLKYTFTTGGTYYIGVSGFDNSGYDPELGGSGVSGSTGDYQLNLAIQRILTWDGGGADGNWTTAANWVGDQAPQAGDVLIFPSGAARLSNTNNLAAGTAFESITLNGGGYTIAGNAVTLSAGLINTVGTNIVKLPITLNGAQTFSATAATTLQVNGTVNNAGHLLTVDTAGTVRLNNKISGAGGLTKIGTGSLVLAGNSTYSGGTTLSAGILALNHNNALGTGALTVTAGVLRANAAARTLPNPLTLAGNFTIAGTFALTLSGTTTLTGNRTITVTNTALTTISGNIGESGGVWKLTKGGAGTLVLSGTNTYTGATTVNLGKLLVNGTQSTSAVTVKTAATLGGSGSVGKVTVQAGGKLSPGSSPAILNTKNLVFNASSTYAVELNGTTAGTGYDRVTVTGTVNLGSSALSVLLGFTPTIDNTFTIITNDGVDAVTGTFSGLAEGATISQDGVVLQISYVGGTGNDVVLTQIS